VEEAAEKFISARRVPNTAIANDLPVVPSIPDAYLIHSAIARAGEVIVGWKVGASNDGAQQRLGLNAPFRAPLFSPNVRLWSTPNTLGTQKWLHARLVLPTVARALHFLCMAVRDAGFHIQKCCTDMSCLHICETRRGPCPVAWEELGAKLSALEAEFAFTIKTAIAPRPSKAYTEEDVWACVDSLSVAIEIAATRCDVIVFAWRACGCHRMLRLGFRI